VARPITLSDMMEEDLKEAAAIVAETVLMLAGEHGDRPPFRPEWPDELFAAQYLVGWYVYGNSEGDVQEAYWDDILDGTDYVTGEVNPLAGPQDAIKFNRRCQKLWRDPDMTKVALLAATEDEIADYQDLLATGMHFGLTKPLLEEWIEYRAQHPGKAIQPVRTKDLMQFAMQRVGPPMGQPSSVGPYEYPTAPNLPGHSPIPMRMGGTVPMTGMRRPGRPHPDNSPGVPEHVAKILQGLSRRR
jgi:hypothetical protein